MLCQVLYKSKAPAQPLLKGSRAPQGLLCPREHPLHTPQYGFGLNLAAVQSTVRAWVTLKHGSFIDLHFMS